MINMNMRKEKRWVFVAALCLLLMACSNRIPAPVIDGAADSAGVHTVSGGETIYSIAQRYRINMPDLVHVNRLSPPYFLDAGERLDLPPPNTYKARSGDTLYNISRLFNVSMTELARKNKLKAPYRVKEDQVLQLPSAGGGRTYTPNPKPQEGPKVAARSVQPVKKQIPIKTSVPKRSGAKFAWPVNGPVISSYGPKKDGLHNDGINIGAQRGTPIIAAENGVVVYADDMLTGFGNLVLLRHEGRWMSAYAHMDRFDVSRGQEVKRGQVIGAVGSSGTVARPQLHFEIRRGTEALDPQLYLGQQGS